MPISSKDNKDNLFECLNLSIQSYLEKPISKIKLEESLFNILRYLNQDVADKIDLGENIFYDPYNSSIEKDEESSQLTKKREIIT